jgi:lipopolysaccharide/colanic/teichoic acid biosynthesis glycosyltransferase
MTKSHVPLSKRILDLVLAIPGVILLSPLLGIIALLVRVYHGRPVLFKQLRPGLGEKPFILYKFRTMTGARDTQGQLLPDECG